MADLSPAAQSGRYPIALVVDQLQHMLKKDAAHLLSKLRDRYAERTIVAMKGQVLSSQELLALGFVRKDLPSASTAIYLHDPDEFFTRREWNDSRNWANPENFDRFRW